MDIALNFIDNQFFDIKFNTTKQDFELDEGLRTAIIISLFTDKRVLPDELPIEETYRRGWWGDLFPFDFGDQIGSKLWILKREKQTNEVLKRAKEYATECLQWLITDAVAQSIEVETSYPSDGIIAIQIYIQRPKEDVKLKYQFLWLFESTRGE
ncbi:MAG: Phage protein GP46 [bacterium ADurb.Bin212]|nr:MAG: Phage protein GP46 [bacterium ADurb.Bin212]